MPERGMRILLASDGSPAAHAALRIAQAFPWPARSVARGVVALGEVRWGRSQFGAELARSLHAVAEEMRAALAARWPRASVVELHDDAADAICGEARRFRADVIVLGWRGHGRAARILAGSVSRAVVARAKCAVLVARDTREASSRPVRRLALGVDGSDNARRALDFVARLAAPEDNKLTLVSVAPPVSVPPLSLARARVRAHVEEEKAARLREAGRRIAVAAQRMNRRGWHVIARSRLGPPLDELLAEARRSRAQVLVVGAKGRSGMRGMLLGSVAAGALDHSLLPVLVVR
ncbi:MAG TPA: universal stress protein [Burkholderiales bacterium]|nr:universal stress protein [Burkholderiales bacterium]